MSYLASSLIPGETITYQARNHVIVYVRAVFRLLLVLALTGGLVVWREELAHTIGLPPSDAEHYITWAVAALVFYAVLKFVMLTIRYWFREFAVTTRRVVMKGGIIHRQAFDVQLHQVESAVVDDQGLLGRLLGYGKVKITASGGSSARWDYIAKPLEFKRHIETAISTRIASAATPASSAGPTASPPDGPGRFRVVGVNRQTGEDAELVLEAQSLANAKVKGELKGIAVTAVDRL